MLKQFFHYFHFHVIVFLQMLPTIDAKPKSATFNWNVCEIRIFCHFKSGWTMFNLWHVETADNNCKKYLNEILKLKWPYGQYSKYNNTLSLYIEYHYQLTKCHNNTNFYH